MRGAIALLTAVATTACFAQFGKGAAISGQAAASAAPVSCDCTSYPFKPNPPCFGSCVGKLSATPNPDLAAVKGLDPGVSVSIKVLAANPKKNMIDFATMRGKSDLEQAADKSLLGTDLRFQLPPR